MIDAIQSKVAKIVLSNEVTIYNFENDAIKSLR